MFSSTPHLPDPKAMIPTADMDGDKESTDITSSIRYKQGTTGVQNNIVVEIEESNQTGAVSLDPNATDGIFQSLCISLPSLIFGPFCSLCICRFEIILCVFGWN